jgi:hypothetical protein
MPVQAEIDGIVLFAVGLDGEPIADLSVEGVEAKVDAALSLKSEQRFAKIVM